MPSMESDDDFQGSRATALPFPDAAPVRPAPGQAPPDPPAAQPAATSTMKSDASAVADIIKAFSDIGSPALRERLLGLLNALA